MNSKRSLIVSVLATFCLTASVFMILPTQSAYDPWLDYNEDGYIGIDDIFSTASEFASEGDPTKNVNVTNWPATQTLNLSLADSLVIPAGETVELYAEVDGYKKLTLTMNKHTSETIYMYINFKIGGVYTPLVYSNNSIPSGRHFLLKSFEVIGPTMMIEITAVGYPATVSLGLYADY